MRMWNIPPIYLCKNHLCGEHLEHHMFVGSILHNISLKGYIDTGLVEVHKLRTRHNELVQEMLRRGYNHKSILPEFTSYEAGNIDVVSNILDLYNRCIECRKRIMYYNKLNRLLVTLHYEARNETRRRNNL